MMYPGVTFTREAAERIMQAVREWERQSTTVSRPVPRRPLLVDDDCVYLINNEAGQDAPAGALLRLDDWNTTQSRYDASRPDAEGLTDIAVATGAIDSGSEGWAWITGVCDVLASSYASLVFGDRIGSQTDSWYAALDSAGVLRVMGSVPASEQPGGLPAGVGLVRAGFIVGLAGCAGDPGVAVETLGVNTEGTEAAYADVWASGGANGLVLWISTRKAYFDAGDQKLYDYRRCLTFDSCGRLYDVTAETRVEIEAPENCGV